MSRYRVVLIVDVDATGVDLSSIVYAATEPVRNRLYQNEREAREQAASTTSGTELPRPRIASFEVVEAKKL